MSGSSTSRAAAPWAPRGPMVPELAAIAHVLCIVDELDACSEADTLLRHAVELTRRRLALERVAVYLREEGVDGGVFRGTWGTGAQGETTDEHSLVHTLSAADRASLLQARLAGELGTYQPRSALFASEAGRSVVIGEGWIMATPLVAAGNLVGVLYNDSAFTRAPIDKEKQAAVAVLCDLLATLLATRAGKWERMALLAKPIHSALVRRVLDALEDDLSLSGGRLARALGVSAGHLARSFKREMAMSLVDYRNRVRMERFFEAIQDNGDRRTLHAAALAAGFGSYAQFHRTYRKFHGAPPRAVLSHQR